MNNNNLYNVEIIKDDRIEKEYTFKPGEMEDLREYVQIFRKKGYKVRVWRLTNI